MQVARLLISACSNIYFTLILNMNINTKHVVTKLMQKLYLVVFLSGGAQRCDDRKKLLSDQMIFINMQ